MVPFLVRGAVLAALASLLVLPVHALAPATPSVVDAQPQPECQVTDPDAALPFESILCPGIRPGAHLGSPAYCTLNFVVTDGVDLYIGTAGHCTNYVGQSASLASGGGPFGVVAMRRHLGGDWAFIRIHPDRVDDVDPTMCRFGGPFSLTGGDPVRAPIMGEPVEHYGHGYIWGATDATIARAGVVILGGDLIPNNGFDFIGAVSGGDSGSPVRFATGEAAGIATAHLVVDPLGIAPSLVVGMRFDRAAAALADYLGRPVEVVPGDVLQVPPALAAT